MKPYTYSLLAAALACGMAQGAATAYTTPVGYVTQVCAANSDTIVGLPLRKSSAGAGALSASPDVVTTPGSAILTLSGTPGFAVNGFANTHYAKFSSGPDVGKWFAITENTTNTLKVDLNGASTSAVTGNTLEVIKFWTLNELFNPTVSTTDPLTTGNAIVASTSIAAGGRRTSVLIPDLSSTGINLAPATIYFINAGLWKKSGSGNTDFGNDQLWPDTYFVIRNPSTVTSQTNYVISGEVEPNSFGVSLATNALLAQDNFVGLPRPIDVSLNSLQLGGTSAFLSSTSIAAGGRRDQLLVFDNAAAVQNKAPSAIYFYNAGLWKKSGAGNTDFGTDLIPAGVGFIIRKYQTGTGQTDQWTNPPNY